MCIIGTQYTHKQTQIHTHKHTHKCTPQTVSVCVCLNQKVCGLEQCVNSVCVCVCVWVGVCVYIVSVCVFVCVCVVGLSSGWWHGETCVNTCYTLTYLHVSLCKMLR